MKAVIYARVSTKEQASSLSLPTQVEACRDYCARHRFDVAHVFVEKGESAKTANRTEFQRMLSYCRRQRDHVHYLVVYALNRFARDQFDHYAVRAHLHKLGVTLRSVTEPIDESASGKLMEGILASFAQFDNDVRSERTTAGMIQALRRGQWTFQPPLGYLKKLTAGGERTLRHDPERAPLIRRAFEAIARGATAASALDRANGNGLTNRRGDPVSRQTWSKLVTNPLYYGRIQVPKWNIDVRGSFEPIISEDLFLDAQLVLSGRAHGARTHRRSHEDFPLRHFIKCDFCDTPMTAAWSRGKTGSKYGYYRCRNGCQGQSAPKSKLERRWIDYLGSLRPSPEFLQIFEATVLSTWRDTTQEAEAQRKVLQERVAKLQAKKDRLIEVYVYQQAIDKDTYERENLKASEALTLAEMELRDARLEELDVESLLEFAKHLALHADRLWMEAAHEDRQQLQACLFPEGIRYRNGTVLNSATCPIFNNLAAVPQPQATMVSPTGFEPVLPA